MTRIPYAGAIAATLLVTVLGGFAGWLMYLRSHTDAIRAADAARGFSTGGGVLGTFGSGGGAQNAGPGVTAQGFGATSLPQAAGEGSASSTPTSDARLQNTGEEPIKTPRLWQVVKTPIAGFGFIETGRGLELWYAERATGHIFATRPRTGEVERLSNTLMPKTQQALFGKGEIIVRRIEDGVLATFSGTIKEGATSTALLGSTLEKNIAQVSIDTATGELFFVRPTAGGSDIVLSRADGSKQSILVSSPLRNWQPIAVPGRRVIVQLPSDSVPGGAYEVGKNSLTPLLGPQPGLIVVPKASSTALLWSTSAGGTLALFARSGPDAVSVAFNLKTVASKCVWGSPRAIHQQIAYCAVPRTLARGAFLDPWHQGQLHTNDAWWQLDTSSGASQALYAMEEAIDVRDPQIDPSGTWIAFRDGRDESLWALRILK